MTIDPSRLQQAKTRLETVRASEDWADVDELRAWFCETVGDLLAAYDAQQEQLRLAVEDRNHAVERQAALETALQIIEDLLDELLKKR